MDHLRHYNSLIKQAQNRKVLLEYYETHHIIPKCLGGDDRSTNLVKLTAREHFVAHLLLCEMHPNNAKLAYALWAMCTLENTHQARHAPSSRLIERVRKKITETKKQSRWINDGLQDKKVPLSLLPGYIEDGWISGRVKSTTKGRVVVNNGTRDYYVHPTEVHSHLAEGYLSGSIRSGQLIGSNLKTKGRICINNGKETRRVQINTLNQYLSEGWVRGYHYKIDYSNRRPGGRRKH